MSVIILFSLKLVPSYLDMIAPNSEKKAAAVLYSDSI